MRRSFIYVALAVAAIATTASAWFSHRTIVVGRAELGGPAPSARRHEILVGRAAPEFEGVDQNGQMVGTQTFRGRVVVVNVWATWCKPCVEEMPRLEREVWLRFKPKVAVVAVARGERADKIRAFNERAKLTFALVADPKAAIARRFGGDDGIPRSYVISREGVVVHQTFGYREQEFSELVSAVEKAVAQR